MKEQFGAAAAGVFGSGWAWVGVTGDGKLAITSTPNQGRYNCIQYMSSAYNTLNRN